MLVLLGRYLGISYEEVNVWLFCIIWPALTLLCNLNPTCAPGHSVQSTKAEINMTFTDIVSTAHLSDTQSIVHRRLSLFGGGVRSLFDMHIRRRSL